MMHYAAAAVLSTGASATKKGSGPCFPIWKGSESLSSVACLRARLRFDEGRDAEAIRDIIDAMTLSRHITLEGVNIMLLWGYSIENRVSQTLALYLPKLSAGMIKDLKTRLDALPRSESLAAALRIEEKCIEVSVVRKVKEAKDKESLLAFLTQMLESEGRTDAEKGRDPRGMRGYRRRCDRVRGGDAAILRADGEEPGSSPGSVCRMNGKPR